MSDAEFIQTWLVGTAIFAYLAGAGLFHANACMRYYSPPHPDDVKARRYFARVLLASPVWPVLILGGLGYLLLTLVRWAR